MTRKSSYAQRFTLTFLLMIGCVLFTACKSEDYKLCTEKDDLQACNRECARDNKEACAKAEVLRLKEKK